MANDGPPKDLPAIPIEAVEDPTTILLKDDFEGDINRRIWGLKRIADGRWALAQIAGRNALKITIERGDRQEISDKGMPTERSELSEIKQILLPTDTPIWYGFSFYFPPDFVIVQNRLIFAQWKQRTGRKERPFLSFRYIDGELIFQVAHGDQVRKFKKETDLRGVWHDVLVNYRLDKVDSGFAQAWVDGTSFAEYEGKMGYEPPRELTYFKMGLYRDKFDLPQTVYLARFRRGPSKESCLA